jgi:hypothetical protein
LSLPLAAPEALKIDSSVDNSYKLTRSTTRTIPTLPMNSIIRHNPQKRFKPRNIPVVLPVENKYLPICHSKPLLDHEIWAHFDNNFSWIDDDPRKGTTSYGDKTIKREIDARLGDTCFDLDKILNPGNDDDDDGDLTDVFSALNKKKESVKHVTVDVAAKAKATYDLDQFVTVRDMQQVCQEDPIVKQELDVAREQLEELYQYAQSWTYEDLYLHFVKFEQATIYDMKQSMEYILRVRVPYDFKNLEIRPKTDYVKMSQDLVRNDYTDGYDEATEDTQAASAADKAASPTVAPTPAPALEDDDIDDDDQDIHHGMSVTENETVAKKEKLGDEDKLFAKVALRRQKLIARYQLPALYRYIHERHSGIAPPPLVLDLIEELEAMHSGGRRMARSGPGSQAGPRGQRLTEAEQRQLAQAQALARQRAAQGPGNAAMPQQFPPRPQQLSGMPGANQRMTPQEQAQMAYMQQQAQSRMSGANQRMTPQEQAQMAYMQQQAQMARMQQQAQMGRIPPQQQQQFQQQQAQMARMQQQQQQLQAQSQRQAQQPSRAQIERQRAARLVQEQLVAKKK